jgi:aerobic carbon-monoxide dehydrogenase medium subunit
LKPAAFDYFAPDTIEHALQILAEHGDDTKLLAGGQSLVPLMNLRLARPRALIDLNRVKGLTFIVREGDWIRIGAMTRHQQVATSSVVREGCPLLARAAGNIGYTAIRNRGTIGGSLAHADPVSEHPCVALAFDAQLVLRGLRGDRVVTASDFFRGYLTTALAADEILTEIRYPVLSPQTRWSFQEFAKKTGDFAVVAVACLIEIGGSDIQVARIALAGVADRPVRATGAEQRLRGRQPSAELFSQVGDTAASEVHPTSDIHAGENYRRHLVRTLVRRALSDSMSDRDGADV